MKQAGRRALIASAVCAWSLGMLGAWLGFYRPVAETGNLSSSLPDSVGDFAVEYHHELTPRMAQLLGTDDAVWRTYRAPTGEQIYVILVVHGTNWKSVHPPDLCLRGSNMEPVREVLGESGDFGVLTMFSKDANQMQNYVSVYRYGASGLSTGDYGDFALHHAPRAIFRASIRGYLIRVETWAGRDDDAHAAAVSRCRAFLDAAEPSLLRMFPEPK